MAATIRSVIPLLTLAVDEAMRLSAECRAVDALVSDVRWYRRTQSCESRKYQSTACQSGGISSMRNLSSNLKARM